MHEGKKKAPAPADTGVRAGLRRTGAAMKTIYMIADSKCFCKGVPDGGR